MALTLDEKKELAQHIQKGITVICSSIAQLHLSSPDPNATRDETGIITTLRQNGADKWKFTNIEGALLLVRDKEGFCYFKIYDLDAFKLRFHYELYDNLDYKELNDQFHSFEMEGCVCGFNFSDREIAKKFFHRVSKAIPRTQIQPRNVATPSMNVFSPDFSAPIIPSASSKSKFSKDTPNQAGDNMNRSQSKSTGTSTKPRKKKTKQKGGNGNESFGGSAGGPGGNGLFLDNGLLDAENIPSEWKKILRNAGIKKRDLKNPQMLAMIKDTLEQFNISIEPPPLNIEDEEIRRYYTAEQLEEYERYKMEMEAYERDLERYNREMEEYEEQQRKQAKLEELATKMQRQQSLSSSPGDQAKNNMTGEERLRMSVMRFQGKDVDIRAMLPQIDAVQVSAPRMSVARPLLPALPKVPQENEDYEDYSNNQGNIGNKPNPYGAGMMDLTESNKQKKRGVSVNNQSLGLAGRQSKMIISAPGFLADIAKGNHQLKHVSVALPDLKNVEAANKDGILQMLMERMKDQRKYLGEDDNEDSDDGFGDGE